VFDYARESEGSSRVWGILHSENRFAYQLLGASDHHLFFSEGGENPEGYKDKIVLYGIASGNLESIIPVQAVPLRTWPVVKENPLENGRHRKKGE
jgi:hypothetical protein